MTLPPPSAPPTNWFAQGGHAYAQFRPDYPPALAADLAALAPSHSLAVDVGCGNGQLTRWLGAHFAQVLGLDPSADQLAHAHAGAQLRYAVAAAEQLPLPDASVQLLTVAQAAHWFDLPAFYRQVQRVLVPGGVIALISYGALQLPETALQARFAHFYQHEIGPFWPPERQLVDSGYATLDFPWAPLPAPQHTISQCWSLAQLLGYIATWSATKQALQQGRSALLAAFARDMQALWGDASTTRLVQWPIRMRLGRSQKT